MALDESTPNGDPVDDMSVDLLLPSTPSDESNDFGESATPPRIGDEYQIPILPFSGKTSSAQNDANSDKFFLGLPVPVVLVRKEGEYLKQEMLGRPSEPKDIKIIEISSDDENVNNGGQGEEESKELPLDEKLSNWSVKEFLFIPGLVRDCLSDIEKDLFLLGLYIFGKNFTQVRRFVGSKGLESVLPFYYGEFYRSRGYRRWSDCWKMRSRRCVHGHKICSGQRQQELLARILPTVSEECKTALLEVCKTFGEGKMSLEEYIFSLRKMVGTNILVQAVGIGKGKRDLTRMSFESSKSNQVIPIRPEIPIGKACSDLTSSEIVNFLTGDYRLSKARSNDLFWEAVWPRLLARGWHSEEPENNNGYATLSMQTLVFLIPGIKKFSRRKLVKGEHYFDCVADVLNKVAKEPTLLDLETEEDGGNKNKEENKLTDETELVKDDDDVSTRQHHIYLQPRTPNRSIDDITFTVIDTSSVDGKPRKVRELSSLPFEISNAIASENHSQNSNEDSHDESDIVDTILGDDIETNDNTRKIEMLSAKKDGSTICQGSDISVPNLNLKHKKGFREDGQSRKPAKSRLSKKLKQENVDDFAPSAKSRRRLTACSRNETRSLCSENISGQDGSSQEKLSHTGSSKESPSVSVECTEPRLPNVETRAWIDLNFPQVLPELDNAVIAEEIVKEEDKQTLKQDDHCAPNGANTEEQLGTNSRRHSTRNRPLTVRALEALANGFLTTNRKRKNKDTTSRENPPPRPPRYARDVVALNEVSNDTMTSEIQQGENDMCNGGDSNMCNKFQVLKGETQEPGFTPLRC